MWWARYGSRLFGSWGGHGCEGRHTPHMGTCGWEKGESMVLSKDGHGGCRASRSTRGWPGGRAGPLRLGQRRGRCHAVAAGQGGVHAPMPSCASSSRPARRTGKTPYAPHPDARRAQGRRTTGHRGGAGVMVVATSTAAARLRLGYDRHSLDSPLLVVRTYVLASGRRAPDA